MSNMLVSTRDQGERSVGYSEALLSGLAPDGGLFTPSDIPHLSEADLRFLSGVDYVRLFTIVKSRFVDKSIDLRAQEELAAAAFTHSKFPDTVNGNYMPIRQLSVGFLIQDLSGGPTAAFKDAALQPLAQDMNHVLEKRGETLRLLGATSGDTGSAAEAAVKGLSRLSLFMLSPLEGMSDFQRAQMGQLGGGNIHNLSVRGRFDDCQDMVKEVNSDPEFADLGAVNSINWGRISSQIPYYVSGYLQAVGKSIGDPVDFVVPTGNFGNVLAGYFAREMGVPINRLIVATNENNVIDRVIQTGRYERQEAQVTSSPSMDISKASNFERLVYYMMNGDPEATGAYMQQFNQTGSVDFADFGLPSNAMRQLGFESGSTTHAERLATIKATYDESGVVIDPHTADAVNIASKFREDGVPIISMSTAKPVKFEPTIREALGFVPDREKRFIGLEEGGDKGFTIIDPDTEALKNYIRSNS